MGGVLFSPLNFGVLSAYLLAMIGIGLWFARRQKTTEDFFLAGRQHAVADRGDEHVRVADERGDLHGPAGRGVQGERLPIVVASSVLFVAPFLIWIFYPFYQRLQVTTSYEYIGRALRARAARTHLGAVHSGASGLAGHRRICPAIALSGGDRASALVGHRARWVPSPPATPCWAACPPISGPTWSSSSS